MKQLSTIVASLAFVIAGAMIIGIKTSNPVILPSATVYANPQPFSLNELGKLPLDVQLDLAKRTSKDTVYIDTSRVDTVYKTKIRKVVVPEVVEKHDTLCVPIFYIAKPLEHKIESTEIIIVDDVHVIDSTETNHIGELSEE